MPELPEVETIARDLNRAVAGARIARVTVRHPDVLRETTARQLQRRVEGATITRFRRRAKMIVTELSSGDNLVVHLRFTGALLIDDGTLSDAERRYSTVALHLADGRVLHFREVRRLGTLTLMTAARWRAYSGAVGVEPLERGFTAARLATLLRSSRQAVKKVIMDQRKVAGVGNIYAAEALWRAGVDPSRAAASLDEAEAARLRDAIVAVLRQALAARGTSFRDYRDAGGERGGFAGALDVYGRGGLPCRRCGARLVSTHAVDGRATVFCAHCQR